MFSLLFAQVYKAHVISDDVIFLPEVGDVTPARATAGQVSFRRVNGQCRSRSRHLLVDLGEDYVCE